MIKKIYKIILIISAMLFIATTTSSAASCLIPDSEISKNTEVKNFLNEDISTIFMGEINSVRVVRQGGGYKFLEIFFYVKDRDFKKGVFPENGEIKIYVPYSESICGYSDKEYFSPGKYAVVFSKKNNGFNVTDRTALNRIYSKELDAREFLNHVEENDSIKNRVTMVSEDNSSWKKIVYLWILVSLIIFIAIIILLRKIYLNKENDGYYEDDDNMYFSTKGDEIEIRVKKNNKV